MPPEPFRLLFVCLGNICRSPAADGVMRDVVEKSGLSARIEIDSAGTEGWHSGKLPDQRMRQAASARGLTLDHRARQFKAADLERFDLILAMDRDNERNIRALDRENRHTAKIRLFCDFCTDHSEREVPDPYYGGPEGFEHVLDLIEDGCEGLLREVKSRL
jgi:protein-tyrosine phosphatase